MKLYKTTIIIWSEEDPTEKYELKALADEAERGSAYCSKMQAELVEDPTKDPDWDGTEFFGEEMTDNCACDDDGEENCPLHKAGGELYSPTRDAATATGMYDHDDVN